jgi:hypothetical protein
MAQSKQYRGTKKYQRGSLERSVVGWGCLRSVEREKDRTSGSSGPLENAAAQAQCYAHRGDDFNVSAAVSRAMGFRFCFFSREEPLMPVHAQSAVGDAKFWLDPEVTLATNHGYSRRELRDIERIIREQLETLRHEWDAFCSQDTHSS